MKVKEILERMADFTDEERQKYIGGLCNKVCSISKASLLNFQNSWDGTKTFDEFKTTQNKVIKECIEMEISAIGTKIRKRNFNLEPLTLETEIN